MRRNAKAAEACDILDDGSLDYVLQAGNISADSNTGILNAATDYYLATGDQAFVARNKAVLLRAADYLVARDLDGDGLVETFRDGNGGRQFGGSRSHRGPLLRR